MDFTLCVPKHRVYFLVQLNVFGVKRGHCSENLQRVSVHVDDADDVAQNAAALYSFWLTSSVAFHSFVDLENFSKYV